MLSYTEMWNLVSTVVEDEGFYLYDLDLPSGRKGRMLIFITDEGGRGSGVNLDDCARISRRLSYKFDVELDIPGSYVLEVSSPGINRRLRRPEHFKSAVGERVRLVVDGSFYKTGQLKGVITSCEEQTIHIKPERKENDLSVPLGVVREASVDFDFRTTEK